MISTLKKQLVYGLLSHHVIAEGFNNVGCLQRDRDRREMKVEMVERWISIVHSDTVAGRILYTKQVVNECGGRPD